MKSIALNDRENGIAASSEAQPTDRPSGAAADQYLYEIRRKIYPRAVRGWFAGWRLALVLFTQVIFYGMAWLEWNGRQAVLFDLLHRKFYIFGLVFWPQDFIYLAGILIVSALSLFLFTAVAGRLWCGYACPQTVYTEIFLWVERKIEGSRAARMKLDQAPLSARKFGLKVSKHAAWAAIAVWTGFTFVGYFTPIRELWDEVMQLSTGPWENFWILFYGLTTYGNAGWMREQVCKYMCPYARFQSAMFDNDTMIITYDRQRGEPRGARSRNADPGALGLGHCVDCGICVQVCPTGIDIRDGLQYECIECAACVDGCNQVMDRLRYPRGLIRFSTARAIEHGFTAKQMFKRVFRPRVIIYASVLAAIVMAMIVSLWWRVPLKVDVIRDRASMSREVEGGMIENVYRLQIMNTAEIKRKFVISASGLPTIFISGDHEFELPGATTRMVPVKVRVLPGEVNSGAHRIDFTVRVLDANDVSVREKSVFIVRQ